MATETTGKAKKPRVLEIKYANGCFAVHKKGEAAPRFHFDPLKASAENRMRASVYGWTQRLADFASDEDGEEKFEKIRRLRDHLESGSVEWSPPKMEVAFDEAIVLEAMVRSGLAPDAAGAESLVRRLGKKSGLDVANPAARESVLKEWAATKQVSTTVAEIRAERAKRADAADLLEGLPDDDEE